MVSFKYLLGLAGVAAATVNSTVFGGQGQIRTLWNSAPYTDLGCLTSAGQWTANPSLCAVFTAVRPGSIFTLTTSAGPCEISGANFTCGAGNTPGQFGIWPWPNSPPKIESLRWGQYGLMSTPSPNPISASDAAVTLRYTSYWDSGYYVWLTWKGV
ncbi:hypothetical protein B0T17DRAFT_570668 [Bombardia bombarda]|uniref:RNase T2-like C-terminal domain-containing protein n=1 Tax=Bombardia bombarda TaxID=252184 RepID=A0AA39XLV6_9PEZI|nr:hypothetical protein B0T17DRAFT_570668 [Bombardia bombarda]